MKIYLASSWRNTMFDVVLSLLRREGHEVYNFKEGMAAFSWGDIGVSRDCCLPDEFRAALATPQAERAFRSDMAALQGADACVLVLPCNRSAHLELGFAVGRGIPTFVLLEAGHNEPELTYKMCSLVTDQLGEIVAKLRELPCPVCGSGPGTDCDAGLHG